MKWMDAKDAALKARIAGDTNAASKFEKEADAMRPMIFPQPNFVGPPKLVTNGMVWSQMMPYVNNGTNTVPLDSPRWLTLDRYNTNTHQWTNCYDGPLTNGQYFFNSSAPMGVLPEYRATVSFQNSK